MSRKPGKRRTSAGAKRAASNGAMAAKSVAIVLEPIRPQDADNVAYDCTTRITGSDRPFDPQMTLEQYGVHTDVQCQSITVLIVNDRNIGVPFYGCHMSANDLRDLAPGWKMGKLSGRIADTAVH